MHPAHSPLLTKELTYKLPSCRIRQASTFLIVLFFNTLSFAAWSQAGTLDTSFGTGGKVFTHFEGIRAGYSSVIQLESGEILAAGSAQRSASRKYDIILAKYNSSGSLVTDFGVKGKVLTTFGESSSAGPTLIQGDGKILTTGHYSYDGIGLVRHLKNGKLDTSFGDSGIVVIEIMGFYGEIFGSLAFQSDGKIVAAGYGSRSGNDSSHTIMARFHPDGSLDSSFGTNGILIGGSGRTYNLYIQDDDKILLAGQVSKGTASNRFRFSVLRYNSDGSKDASFGSNGKVYIPITDFSEAYSITVQSDGKILVAGHCNSTVHTPGSDFALTRLHSDGTLDTNFGSNGKLTTSFPGPGKAFNVKVQIDGKIVVLGQARQDTGNHHIALSRYHSNGSLDTSFGSKGTTIVPTKFYSTAGSLIFQKDGKILVAGYADTSGSNNTKVVILRFLSEGTVGQRDICCKEAAIRIFPNPMTIAATILVSAPFQNGEFSLFNTYGQMLVTKELYGTELLLENMGLANGVYFVQVTGENGEIATQRLILR